MNLSNVRPRNKSHISFLYGSNKVGGKEFFGLFGLYFDKCFFTLSTARSVYVLLRKKTIN